MPIGRHNSTIRWTVSLTSPVVHAWIWNLKIQMQIAATAFDISITLWNFFWTSLVADIMQALHRRRHGTQRRRGKVCWTEFKLWTLNAMRAMAADGWTMTGPGRAGKQWWFLSSDEVPNNHGPLVIWMDDRMYHVLVNFQFLKRFCFLRADDLFCLKVRVWSLDCCADLDWNDWQRTWVGFGEMVEEKATWEIFYSLNSSGMVVA